MRRTPQYVDVLERSYYLVTKEAFPEHYSLLKQEFNLDPIKGILVKLSRSATVKDPDRSEFPDVSSGSLVVFTVGALTPTLLSVVDHSYPPHRSVGIILVS